MNDARPMEADTLLSTRDDVKSWVTEHFAAPEARLVMDLFDLYGWRPFAKNLHICMPDINCMIHGTLREQAQALYSRLDSNRNTVHRRELYDALGVFEASYRRADFEAKWAAIEEACTCGAVKYGREALHLDFCGATELLPERLRGL